MVIKMQIIVTTIKMKIMMKYNSIKEIVTGAPNDTQHQIPRPAFNGMEKMCVGAMGVIITPILLF